MKNFILKNFVNESHFKLKKKISVKKFTVNIKKIFKQIKLNNNVFFSLNKNISYSFKFNEIKKYKKFKNIVLIGMGGSILGAEAIHCWFRNKLKRNFLFIDDINNEKIKEFNLIKKKNKTLFIVISKSGNTIETLSNLFALKLVKKNKKNIIIISEKNNNHLFKLAKKMNLKHIKHKNYIGGRYSIFSEVGILPAYLMDININKFRKNLLKNFNSKYKNSLKKNSILLANLLVQKKFQNLVLLNYSPRLNKFLYWYQQLIAESLGKKGKGYLPLISNVPKDHHSLLQIYLDGPKNKFFYIFSDVKKKEAALNISSTIEGLNFLDKKSLSNIKLAQKNALVKSLKKNKIPFKEIIIKDFNEETLGQLFSYFIIETVLIGINANINPYDQPAVEQVKIETKKLLS